MIDELKKSIQSVLYERISSPLSGAFLFSWLVWNWKILYVLFFGEGFQTVMEKLNYIENSYINFLNSILFPILSTAFLVFLYPYLATFVYKYWLIAKKKQSDIKNYIEGQKLLTQEQSLALRLEIRQHKENVNNLLNEKDEEIKLLKEKMKLISEYKKEDKENIKNLINEHDKTIIEISDEIDKLYSNFDYRNEIEKILKLVNNKEHLVNKNIVKEKQISIDKDILDYFRTNDLAIFNADGTVDLTDKGKKYETLFVKKLLHL